MSLAFWGAIHLLTNCLSSLSEAECAEIPSKQANGRTTLLSRATLAWPVEPTCSAAPWRAGCPRCMLGRLGSVRPLMNHPPTCENYLLRLASLF
ncbi:hypothetical protein IWX90DRAFT_14867 [Phyllosticta citrichinensis]|uniref:Secreted protein n=1 Tax=Phyllosticta citrichinensis TaxID=1130410 RepID=A0ABR1Y5W3_9PEZI